MSLVLVPANFFYYRQKAFGNKPRLNRNINS